MKLKNIDAPIIRTLLISFDLRIDSRQISNWRGAFNELAGWEDDLLHNHKSHSEYHYRYPEVQYRMINGKAGIFALNDGVEAVQEVLNKTNWLINWQGKELCLNIEHLQMKEHPLRISTTHRHYQIHQWLPFYDKKYKIWKDCPNLITRIPLLEQALSLQITRFCENMAIQSKTSVEVQLQHILRMRPVEAFHTPMVAFDLEYSTNVLLPNNLALGRGMAKGFGWQKNVNTQKKSSGNNTQKHLR